MRTRRAVPLLWVTLVLMPFMATTAWSHEGHDHAQPEPVAADPNLVVRSASNESYEVVLKYRSIRGEKATTARVYLSDFATNTPIEGARVSLRTTSPRRLTAAGAVVSAGVYEAALPYEQTGRYTLILTIGGSPPAEFAFQELPMGEELAAARAAVPAAGGSPWWILGIVLAALLAVLGWVIRRRSGRAVSRTAVALLASAGAAVLLWRVPLAQQGQHPTTDLAAAASQPRYMPKESQFFLGVRTIVGRLESLRARINAVGHVVPESGALASVEAPQSGKLERAGRRLGVGDRVRQGEVIAYLLVIDRLPIRAPISGLVAEVRFTPGQWIQAGDPLIVILDERQVRVELPLFGENLTRALRARDAIITTSALPGAQFPARVRGLAPTAPEPTGKTEGEPTAGTPIPPVLLTVMNRGGLLRPGMLVEVSLELPEAEDLIAVPESAVMHLEAGTLVFVHTAAEVFEQRPVRVAGRYGDRFGLAGDLRPGDRIVVAGAQALASAPPVRTATPAGTTKAER